MDTETRPPEDIVPDIAEDADPTALQGASRQTVRRRLTTLAVLAVTGVAIVTAAYLSDPARATSVLADGTVTAVNLTGAPTGDPPAVGKPAPEFAAVTADGVRFDLADLRGKAVWLTFGATWCQPCRAENPDIEAAYQKYKAQGLVVVQVYIGEDAQTVNDYTNRVGLTYARIPDTFDRLASQ